jgi:peptide chain release factor 2
VGPQWKPKESTFLPTSWLVCSSALPTCGGIFDFDTKAERLKAVSVVLEDPKVWDDQKRAQELGREKKSSKAGALNDLGTRLADSAELFEMARSEGDDATLVALESDVAALEHIVDDMEFRRMFHNPMDPNPCFVDIQAGSGGTEAQDWAAMLERMYLRYCERRGMTETRTVRGEVAGIKAPRSR